MNCGFSVLSEPLRSLYSNGIPFPGHNLSARREPTYTAILG